MLARRPFNPTRRHGVLLGAILILLFALIARAAPTRPADGVILLANSADPDSLRIARHYAAVRRVPEANIIALPLPLAETISWSEFVVTLWQPLQDELIRRALAVAHVRYVRERDRRMLCTSDNGFQVLA